MKSNTKTLIWIAVLVIIAALIFSGTKLYEKGYRLSVHGFATPGTIEIHHFDSHSVYYLDGNVQNNLPQNTDTIKIPIASGTHELIISRDGFYPWQKSFELSSGETVSVDPFAVPSATSGIVLPKSDKEYKPALDAIATTTVPTEAHPLVSSDGVMKVYLKDGSLDAQVADNTYAPQYFCDTECHDEHSIISLQADIRSVAFLPGRNDVVLLAVGSSIFAVELDTRGTQNFEPVYQGIKPSFGPGPGYLYVKDGDSVFIVTLSPAQ